MRCVGGVAERIVWPGFSRYRALLLSLALSFLVVQAIAPLTPSNYGVYRVATRGRRNPSNILGGEIC